MTLERVLGSGSFGAVSFATGHQGDPLAVKVLYPPSSRETHDIAEWNIRASQFHREVFTAASFNHPNILKIYHVGYLFWHYNDSQKDTGEQDRSGDYNLPYYVTDYLPDDVYKRMTNGLFSPEEAVRICTQVCEALEVLHGASILHLDLGPRNIRLAEGGRAVITDFGLVRNERIPPGPDTIEVRWFPPYVAPPEQKSGGRLNTRTDVYQVGALLFFMLTGKERSVEGLVPLIERGDVPASVSKLVIQATRFEPERRFQDVSSLKTALNAAKASWGERFIRSPAHLLADFMSKIPPPLRRPWFWLPTVVAIVGVFAWALGVVFPPEPITITMANSSAKRDWVIQAASAFDKRSESDKTLQVPVRFRTSRRPIVVQHVLEELRPGVRDHYRSGSMITNILSGKIAPTVASPAEQSWIDKLTAEWGGSNPVTSEETLGVVQTPFVIAMWRSRATALGCWPSPGADCTWKRLRFLAESPEGWGVFGHPEWGKLKLGFGEPGKSNSGTFTQVFICMAGLQKTTTLIVEDVRPDNGCGQAVAVLNKAVTLILPKSEDVLTEMRIREPGFLDAASTNEHEVIALNQAYGALLPEPIVAVYPQDGTLMNTHPFAILDGASWVTPEQAQAAKLLREFLLSKQQQSILPKYGLRPADPTAPLSLDNAIAPALGAIPQAHLSLVQLPSGDATQAIIKLWERVRKSP